VNGGEIRAPKAKAAWLTEVRLLRLAGKRRLEEEACCRVAGEERVPMTHRIRWLEKAEEP